VLNSVFNMQQNIQEMCCL